jgi:Dor1-like family/Galactose oxidase, central domain
MVGSKLFVFGGKTDGKFSNDVWAFDFDSRTIAHRCFEPFWLDISAVKSNPVWESYEPAPGDEKPPPRAGHVLVTIGDRIILFVPLSPSSSPGHFQEALDLTAHAARLATRFPHVQAVQDVHAEANGAICALLGQLLATLRAPGKLPSLFRAVSFLRRICVFPERELALAFLTGHLEALNVALASAEGEKRGSDAPDAWVRYMKKYIDTWREGVHDLLTQYVAIFLERPPADLPPEDLHTLRSPR